MLADGGNDGGGAAGCAGGDVGLEAAGGAGGADVELGLYAAADAGELLLPAGVCRAAGGRRCSVLAGAGALLRLVEPAELAGALELVVDGAVDDAAVIGAGDDGRDAAIASRVNGHEVGVAVPLR